MASVPVGVRILDLGRTAAEVGSGEVRGQQHEAEDQKRFEG